MAATPLPPFDTAALADFLAQESGAEKVEIGRLTLLAGGAIQHNWGFTALFSGGRLSGAQPLVLRTDATTGVPSSLSRIEEFAVLRAAWAAGVTAAEPLFASADPDVIGKPFFVMRRLPGTTQGRRITTDPALAPILPQLAHELGRQLAQLQRIRPPRHDLAFLPFVGPAEHVAAFRAYLDTHPRPRPVLEWAIRWLETHVPEPLPPVLCHRDFRTGNYLLDGGNLAAILDWEFAGWGDPDEDIGWFCCKGWRFARLDREAGGIADRAPFYEGYEGASGRRIDPQRVRYWEVLANVRWAIIALQQSDRHLIGGSRDLSTAIIGRRATECDLELLMLLDPNGVTPSPSIGEGWGRGDRAEPRSAGNVPRKHQPHPAPPHRRGGFPLRDMPEGAGLLALAREMLLDELLPLLPPERERDARLIATAMAIAEREAMAGDGPASEIAAALAEFYRADGGGRDVRGSEGEALLQRFASDLRIGAFEACAGGAREARGRTARALLWRLTLLKLREGNPSFLAANGFGE